MIDFAQIDRRAALQHLALLLGVAAVPAEAFAAPRRRSAKRFLSPAQFAVMSAVADTVIPATDTPGALGAGVPAKLDGMLANWASAKTQADVTAALGRIDAAARTAKSKGFAALSAGDRDAVLRPHDVAALKVVSAPPGAPKSHPFAAITYVVDSGYLKLKELVITLYYNSEIAMTQELVYEHVPGVWQPSIKTTPTTRPWASSGPF